MAWPAREMFNNAKSYVRAFAGLGLFSCITICGTLVADEPPAAVQQEEDPLRQALEQLQREVDQLRREIGQASPRQRMKSSLPSAARANPVAPPARSEANTDRRSAPGDSTPARAVTGRVAGPEMKIHAATSDHWSFQPIRVPLPPSVTDEAWVRDDLDRFILARLEQAGLSPNPDADRFTLLRRIAFDLTGLPPTPDEIKEFVGDPRSLDEVLPDLVDRYLASDRFGERWGRHWLDVVRYADSVGRNWNAPFTYAWRYRDYVIDSLNSDKPYDRFITEQLAGDLLPAESTQAARDQLRATGFLALGAMDIIEPEGESLMMDRVDEQIDVTTRAFLGLTVACARCHDHKYEPISMRDYYALAGVFYSTETRSGQRRGNYVDDDDLIVLPNVEGETSPVPGVHSMADMTREHRSGGWREVHWTTDPHLAMAAIEGRVADCPIRTDGEAYKRGSVPPRGDFHFAGMSGLGTIPAASSGRRQLAAWIASRDNPLTARVMINRIWFHLHGRGLVPTVDNFGVSGGEPSDATDSVLLDHLASRFQRTWSIKSIIRSLVLSRTYRLASTETKVGVERDGDNALHWRGNVRRLEVEAVRDAMLAAANKLSFDRPSGIQVAGTGGKGRWGQTRSLLDIHAPYRTVYLPVLRSELPEMYTTFDFPNPTQVKGRREVTTVAPQSLFLMNSDFAVSVAQSVARRALRDNDRPQARVQRVYLLLLGRAADKEEVYSSLKFMDSLSPSASEAYRWTALVQALMISGEFRTLL